MSHSFWHEFPQRNSTTLKVVSVWAQSANPTLPKPRLAYIAILIWNSFSRKNSFLNVELADAKKEEKKQRSLVLHRLLDWVAQFLKSTEREYFSLSPSPLKLLVSEKKLRCKRRKSRNSEMKNKTRFKNCTEIIFPSFVFTKWQCSVSLYKGKHSSMALIQYIGGVREPTSKDD